MLEAWFPTIWRDREYKSGAAGCAEDIQNGCIVGHFGARIVGDDLALLDLLPGLKEPNEDTLFTVLRDPLDHAVSTYYHMRDVDNDRLGSLDEFLENGHPFQSSVALGIYASECIGPALDSFSLVGDASNLELTFDVLADHISKPRVEVPTVRVGTRDAQIVALNASKRSRFEKMWPLDYEIYEIARDRLRRGPTFLHTSSRQFFPHVEKAAVFTSAALEKQDKARKEWSARPKVEQRHSPPLPPEVDMLLAKKDARILELEQKIIDAEDRGRALLARLSEEGLKHGAERSEMLTRFSEINAINEQLRKSVEKQAQKIAVYKQKVEILTSQVVCHAKSAKDAQVNEDVRRGADGGQHPLDRPQSIDDLKHMLHEIDLMVSQLKGR